MDTDMGGAHLWIIVLVVIVLVIAGIMLVRRRRGKGSGYSGGAERRTLLPAGSPPHSHEVTLDAQGDGLSTAQGAPAHRHAVERHIDTGLNEQGADLQHKHSIADHIVDA